MREVKKFIDDAGRDYVPTHAVIDPFPVVDGHYSATRRVGGWAHAMVSGLKGGWIEPVSGSSVYLCESADYGGESIYCLLADNEVAAGIAADKTHREYLAAGRAELDARDEARKPHVDVAKAAIAATGRTDISWTLVVDAMIAGESAMAAVARIIKQLDDRRDSAQGFGYLHD